ncbi:hypothetical protein [Schleiferilactobacillus harbinensis]|jgi:uncharacterized membrane protein YesL|uniref:hypothetical protein n=1 Tax=Schleiferilactobacillus harbinensis TaxID=304207 RepID=UPI00242FCC5B|nr:hypothetical protein [Schleiferilactobacillus harbinensis]MCI1688077.1 hypothetical protein [Schleiferilactobacillus harbinensis]MCI1782976.1 hypothetical protein [Schleiferilactobacillus harbinensis]MCI1851503.1 hypothetical protein [Schleiferilactobacillus harbinensis]
MLRHSSVITKWIFGILQSTGAWFITNFIYILLVLNLLFVRNIAEVNTIIVTALALIPFVLTPGILAAFASARRFFNESNALSYWQTIRTAYTTNYRLAMKTGFVYLAGLIICYASYIFYGQWGIMGEIIPMIVAFLGTFLYLFILAYESDREEQFWHYWRNGFLLLIRHPMLMLFMMAESGLVVYFCHFLLPLLLFVAPGAVALIVMYFYRQCVQAEEHKSRGRR